MEKILMSDALSKLMSPAKLNGLNLRNRILKSATLEGLLEHCKPSQRLIDFHVEIVRGGTAMTTVSYCSPEPDGRIHDDLMYIHEGIQQDLQKMATEVHAAGGKISGQLVHCGGLSGNATLKRRRPLAPSMNLNLYGLPFGMFLTDAMTEQHMAEVLQGYSSSAATLRAAGFDAIEIQFGHGFLLSQFLSPKTNKRSDNYGGSIGNRMRFPLRVLSEVRRTVGDSFPILAKISMSDKLKGGISIQDSIEVCKLLEKNSIDGIVLSGGDIIVNPMAVLHGDSFRKGLIKYEKRLAPRMGLQTVGALLFKSYPYQELYFLNDSLKVRDSVKGNLIYVGGCTTPDSFEKIISSGFDFVQLGRALIRDPQLVQKLNQQKSNYVNGCVHCNECLPVANSPLGIHCVKDQIPGQ